MSSAPPDATVVCSFGLIRQRGGKPGWIYDQNPILFAGAGCWYSRRRNEIAMCEHPFLGSSKVRPHPGKRGDGSTSIHPTLPVECELVPRSTGASGPFFWGTSRLCSVGTDSTVAAFIDVVWSIVLTPQTGDEHIYSGKPIVLCPTISLCLAQFDSPDGAEPSLGSVEVEAMSRTAFASRNRPNGVARHGTVETTSYQSGSILKRETNG